jgi:hypothetical protein
MRTPGAMDVDAQTVEEQAAGRESDLSFLILAFLILACAVLTVAILVRHAGC